MQIYRAAAVGFALILTWSTLASAPASGRVNSPSGKVIFAENFGAHAPGRPWADGVTYGRWRAVYDGYGSTTVKGPANGRYLSLSPRRAKNARITHGGLVVTKAKFGNVDLSAGVRTVQQLRLRPRGNPWEVGWLLWNYTDDDHFYSVALKPNGWELGKEDPAYPGSQRFLSTGASPKFALNSRHTIRVRQVGNRIAVWADGRLLTTFVDRERPYRTGKAGLYSEDARVNFDHIVIRQP